MLPPKMGEGVLGSRVGGFHGAFSFFSSAIALLSCRARLGTETLLRSAVPWKLLWRVPAEQGRRSVQHHRRHCCSSGVLCCSLIAVPDKTALRKSQAHPYYVYYAIPG